MRTLIVLTLVVGMSAPLLGADVVERRGGAAALEGTISRIDDSGVQIAGTGGGSHFVPWDRVRSVQSTGVHQRDAEQYSALAGDLWRARSRVERGDTGLAEPLFEKVFERYRGKRHETALVVAEGLLRCRLARGDRVLAVVPALEAARLRRAGVSTTSYSLLDPVIDGATSLCPQLAPAWNRAPVLARLETELTQYDAQGDEVMTAIAALYRRAVKQLVHESGVVEREPVTAIAKHEGVELMSLLVRSGGTDPEDRRAAVEALERRMPSLPPWGEAWARYQVGAALLGRDEPLPRQRGMLHLLHLPARWARAQPYLAAMALDAVADALQRDGQAEAAASLREELARNFAEWVPDFNGRRPPLGPRRETG